LAIAALFQPTAHTNDDESDADDDGFAESNGTTDKASDDGLT
jgi:hypothetical protein